MIKIKAIILIMYLFVSTICSGQIRKVSNRSASVKGVNKENPSKPSVQSSKVFALARVTNNTILIRWATTDYYSWKLCNEHGFAIEKFTVMRDGKLLEQFERSQPKLIVKPKPLNEWDSLANSDDYAAVVAQALYGDDFDVSMNDNSGLATIINKTETNQQRFNMAMYGADHSFTAASYAALAYTDKNVKKGEKYFYRIYSLVPAAVRKIDTAKVFLGLQDYKPLPKPSQIIAEFGDKSVMLRWDFNALQEYYTSYMVERSVDSGKTFSPVSDRPVTKLDAPDQKPGSGSVMYIDTLSNNQTQYQYRIAGVSLFGDTGPYSEVISGRGKNILTLTPAVTGVSQNDKGKYLLHWEMDDSAAAFIKEFNIKQSEDIDGTYKTVKQHIPANTRVMEVDSLSSSNYFVVSAISTEDEEKTSLPYLLQPEDSVAPATPIGFIAEIDSVGIITLKWKPNPEKDLAGYRIFKTNVKGHEMVPLVDSLIVNSEFTDTSNLESLNSKLYYTIRAVDRRYNQSAYSQVLEVLKPDVIPPSQPVMSSFDMSTEGIKLIWVNSSSEDVVLHNLYRKTESGAGKWELIQGFRDLKTTSYVDKNFVAGKNYSYTVIAVDSGKLESAPAIPLTVQAPDNRTKIAIKSIDVEVDRDNRNIAISWKKATEVNGIKQYELYRGDEKQKLSLYKIIDANTQNFVDTDLQVNTKYKYGIRAIFSNGKNSDFIIKTVIY